MNEFNPAQAILISADSIEQLRRCDVFRVLEWTPEEHRETVANYIWDNRPDLHHAISEALTDLMP
jgi:hypothetical protein